MRRTVTASAATQAINNPGSAFRSCVNSNAKTMAVKGDRIVPPKSDPVDLSVFCVEPGRWVARSEKFGYMGSQMAQLSVRAPAMNEKSQTAVWDNVRESSRNAAKASANSPVAVHMICSQARGCEAGCWLIE